MQQSPREAPRKPIALSVTAAVFVTLTALIGYLLWQNEAASPVNGNIEERRASYLFLGYLFASALCMTGVVLVSVAIFKWLDHAIERPPAKAGLRWLRWAAPLFICVILVMLFPAIRDSQPDDTNQPHFIAAVMLSFFGSFIVIGAIITNLILMIAGIRLSVYYGRKHGTALASQQEIAAGWDRAWQDAQRTAGILLAGGNPPAIEVHDYILGPDEQCFFDGPMDYARFYSMNVQYTHTSGLYFGPVGFVAVASAANAIANKARRDEAARLAAAQWRDFQLARVIITNQRLIVRRDNQWIDFAHELTVSLSAEPNAWYLVGEYQGTSAIRLSGQAAPIACVLLQSILRGRESLARHPAFQEVIQPPQADAQRRAMDS